MQILVNGDQFDIEEGVTIVSLLARIGTSTDHVAVEHNGQVVEPSDFATLKLEPEDRLEVVHFVGGG